MNLTYAKTMLTNLTEKLSNHPIGVAASGGSVAGVLHTTWLTDLEKHTVALLSIAIMGLTLYGQITRRVKKKKK